MGSAGQSDRGEDRIKTEIQWCFTFDRDGGSCAGASGRKLRQVCVWCPKFQKKKKKGVA